MSFFSSLFEKKQTRAFALLDISSGSIGAAYAVVPAKGVPQLLYTLRVPIEMRTTETPEAAMERALAETGEQLVREGAPVLFRATGRGSADVVLAAVSAPWQDMSVRTERIHEKRPFVFTESLRDRVLSKSPPIPENRVLVDESCVGTLLDGYLLQNPFGKKATHAELVVLTSTISKTAAAIAAQELRELFHTKEILFIAGTSLRYQVLCTIFSNEKNYLILDAGGPEVSAALIRGGVMVASRDRKSAVTNEEQWVAEARIVLQDLAQEYPLPHTIFLIAPTQKRQALKEALSGTRFGSLWLSEVPPTIVALAPQHLANFAKHLSEREPDVPLLLMTLHARSTLAPE